METNSISFNELRKIKHSLPKGSVQKIADELGVDADTVRNYFGANHEEGGNCGIHIEPGPEGGIVVLDDLTILNKALEILESTKV